MKKLIVLVALVLIAQTIQSATAMNLFKGQLIRNLQSNQFDGKKLAILTEDERVFPLIINDLPKKLQRTLNYSREQQIEVYGNLLAPSHENNNSASIEVASLLLVDDSEISSSVSEAGILSRGDSDNYNFKLTTKRGTYKFKTSSIALDRILNQYLNQIIHLSGYNKDDHYDDYSDECYYDDEYDEYVDEWGEYCDPDDYEDYDDDESESKANFELRSVALPTKFATHTGKVNRQWQSGGYVYTLVDPALANDEDADEDSIEKTQIWLSPKEEEIFLENYNDKVISVSGPIFKYKGQNMVHAETIQIVE
jgi:hypothetical protein